MKSLEPDFPEKNWTDLLPYEVKGSNKSELVCAATSPDDAIDQFMNAFPDEEFYSISAERNSVGTECRQPEKEWQRFRCGQWVALGDERVMVLRSRLIEDRSGAIERHYETSLGQGEWIPESEIRTQTMEALAA
jgi:hypothetical protein